MAGGEDTTFGSSLKHMGRIVLLPHGTAGDVLPYIFLGRLLIERGHQVTMIWIESFRAAAERAGLQYVAMADGGFEDMLRDPVLWQPHEGLKLGFACAGRCVEPCLAAFFEDMARHGLPDLLVAPHPNFAARLLREKLGVPLISVLLYPMAFVSAHEIPEGILAARWLRLLPVFVRRLILTSVAPYDRFAMPHVIENCRVHGVTPPSNLNRAWWHSPDGVLALFPAWYGRPQPDWPANCLQWDFPLEDLSAEKPLSPELASFLDEGEKPVVFTLGTGNYHARQFFATAVEVCSRIGCRGVLVTRDHSQLPDSLPSSIIAVKYAAFGVLLPRARAFVHHGGIGTLAQCFKAGLPQLIVHMGFDQPDNAKRLERMGAGVGLNIQKFDVRRALPLLRRCLEDASIRQNAVACKDRLMRSRPSAGTLVEWMEHRMRPSSSL